MKNSSYVFALAAFAVVLVFQQVHAACGSSQRVSYSDSWCLSADLDSNNGNFFSSSRWTLENLCAGTTMKAKADMEAHGDFDYTIAGGSSASGSSRAKLRTAHCCKDGSTSVNDINMCTFEDEASFDAAVAAE